MPPSDETQPIGLTEDHISRIRRVIPKGQDFLLDNAIRKQRFGPVEQLKSVTQALQSYTKVRLSAQALKSLTDELLNASTPEQLSDQAKKQREDIEQAAVIDKLYQELNNLIRSTQ